MIRRHLYMQICLVVAVGMLAFAVFAAVLWNFGGHERYHAALFDMTSGAASLLLPPADAPESEQAAAVRRIAETLDLEISLWHADKTLVEAKGPVRIPLADNLSPGEWLGSEGDTYWTSLLPDGRWLVVYLDSYAVRRESTGVALILVVLAGFISAIMFPFVRQLTRRLERLQHEVVRIGQGNLGARVDVQGDDEIALLARSFNDSADRIENLVSAQRLLLANASHELRTPLARIRLGIEMLMKTNNPERRELLQNDISELDALIDELILMTRLDTGMTDTSFEPIDLLAILAEECARYRGCEFEGAAGIVSGDARMLQHLVRNLIDNAHKHGEPPVRVSLEQMNGRLALLVSDSGAGIPASERDKVIQPFYRGGDRQNVPGYGLGLAIVQKIAQLHGAAVSIQSEPKSEIKVTFDARVLDGAPAGTVRQGNDTEQITTRFISKKESTALLKAVKRRTEI